MIRAVTAPLLLIVLPMVAGCGVLAGREDDESRVTAAPESGTAALHLGLNGLATGQFGAAVARDPASAAAWNGLGAAYDALGRRDLARRAYAHVMALAPAAAEPLNNIGASYQADGRYDLAVAMLRGASARDGANPVIFANRNAAERALAAAGGPPVRRPRPAGAVASRGPLQAAFKPRIVRTGRGELTLVTRPPPEPIAPTPSGAGEVMARTGADLPVLPGYLAAPLVIDPPARAVARAVGMGSVPR